MSRFHFIVKSVFNYNYEKFYLILFIIKTVFKGIIEMNEKLRSQTIISYFSVKERNRIIFA